MQSEPPMHLTPTVLSILSCVTPAVCAVDILPSAVPSCDLVWYPSGGIIFIGDAPAPWASQHRYVQFGFAEMHARTCARRMPTPLPLLACFFSLEIFYLEIGHRPQWQCVLYLPTSFCSKQVVRKVKLMALLAHCLAPYVCFISLQYLIPNICNLFCQTEEPSAYSSPVYFPLADGMSWSRWRWEQLADEGESINLVAFWFVGFTHGRLLLLYSIDWLSTSLSSPWQKILNRS